jgi:hypothetical protein
MALVLRRSRKFIPSRPAAFTAGSPDSAAPVRVVDRVAFVVREQELLRIGPCQSHRLHVGAELVGELAWDADSSPCSGRLGRSDVSCPAPSSGTRSTIVTVLRRDPKRRRLVVSRSDAHRLADMIMAADEIAAITQRGRGAFDTDVVLRRAVERCLEIIGEAPDRHFQDRSSVSMSVRLS